MYLVIEIVQRNLISITPKQTKTEAIELANELLKQFCSIHYKTELYNQYANLKPGQTIGTWPPAMHLCDPSEHTVNTWANLDGDRFDAHIWEVTPETYQAILTGAKEIEANHDRT